ncbi:RNA polymerase factor sigma-54 [Neisseria gonorrhoeae]
MLAFRGIEVSRRTVAKYRESLEIPAAHKRKTAE